MDEDTGREGDMSKYHIVEDVKFDDQALHCRIDGKPYSFLLKKISSKLFHASGAERERYEISPSGYGIHWPGIDEDLSIDGLLGIEHQPSPAKARANT